MRASREDFAGVYEVVRPVFYNYEDPRLKFKAHDAVDQNLKMMNMMLEF